MLMARVNLRLERFDLALAQLQRAAPNDQGPAYHYMMGKVLEVRNDATAAEQHYARATALSGSREAASASVLQLIGE